MGSLLDKKAAKEVIFKALENGITFFDTAPLYGNSLSEEIIGEALVEAGQEAIICTKAGLRIFERKDKRFGVEVEKLNEEYLKGSLERSLKRLKRDSIDLFMLHAFDPNTPIEETLASLNRFYREGKIKSFGCSNFNPEQLQTLLKKKPDNLPFVAAQCHYNLIERRASRSFIPLCEKNQIWVVVNRVLARGALTGQYRAEQPLPMNSRAASSKRIQKWLTPQKLRLLDDLSSIAQKCKTSLMDISLQWLLRNHSQLLILLGVKSARHLEDCLHSAQRKIDDSVFETIEAAIRIEKDVYTSPPRYFEK